MSWTNKSLKEVDSAETLANNVDIINSVKTDKELQPTKIKLLGSVNRGLKCLDSKSGDLVNSSSIIKTSSSVKTLFLLLSESGNFYSLKNDCFYTDISHDDVSMWNSEDDIKNSVLPILNSGYYTIQMVYKKC